MDAHQASSDSAPSSPEASFDARDAADSAAKRKKVLAISSGGGHWVQLQRLKPAFEGCDVLYATTRASYECDVTPARFKAIPDANRWSKLKLLNCAFRIALLIAKEQPDVIVTTGAAPGYFAIRIGKLFGKKTIWIDSIANAEELSMSGQKAGRHAQHWLTQWKHLAQPEGPHFHGSVLG